MEKKQNKKILVIKAAVSAAFFFILLSFVRSNELVAVFGGVNWTYFALSLVLSIAMLCVSCLKWMVLLRAAGHGPGFMTLLRFYLVGYFFSNLLPSTIGGDVARSYYTGRLIRNQAASAAAIFMERFTGMLLLLLLVVAAPLAQPALYRKPMIYLPAAGAAAILLLLLWVWLAREPFAPGKRVAGRFLDTLQQLADASESGYFRAFAASFEKFIARTLGRLRRFREELRASLGQLRSDKRLFFFIVIITVLFYLLTWVNVYAAFLAFNVRPGFTSICALVPAIMFVGQIPLTLLGNLGFVESVFVVYFFLIDVPAAESLAMGLLLRLKILWLGGMGYLCYLSLPRDKGPVFDPPGLAE